MRGNGNVALAYQVIGRGPIDLVYLQGPCSLTDMNWESPYLVGLLRAPHAADHHGSTGLWLL
jgi:hypothetical protein